VSVALVIQQAKRMRLIILSHVAGLSGFTVFFHVSQNGMIFGEKKGAEHKMCVLIFSTYCV
jgi:hypothetical protein